MKGRHLSKDPHACQPAGTGFQNPITMNTNLLFTPEIRYVGWPLKWTDNWLGPQKDLLLERGDYFDGLAQCGACRGKQAAIDFLPADGGPVGGFHEGDGYAGRWSAVRERV